MSKPTKYAFSNKALAECIKASYGIAISDRSAGAALDYFASKGRKFREARTAAMALAAYRRYNGKWPRLSEDERISERKKLDGSGRPKPSAQMQPAAIDDMWYDRPIVPPVTLPMAIAALRKAGIKSITLA